MAMIESTLKLIRDSLNSFLRNLDPRKEDWVSLSNIVDQDGHVYAEAKHRIVMFLANIQHETTISTYQRTVPAGDGYIAVPPPLYIDLFLLFYANFPDVNYLEGLDKISQTISYFQQNWFFTRSTMPGLDPAIDKITMEFSNLDPTGLNYVMGMAGVKYLPSVYYKLRMLPFCAEPIQEVVPVAKGVKTAGEPDEDPLGPQLPREIQRSSEGSMEKKS